VAAKAATAQIASSCTSWEMPAPRIGAADQPPQVAPQRERDQDNDRGDGGGVGHPAALAVTGIPALLPCTLYPPLHRLEHDGLITRSWSDDAPRRRRVHGIAARGHKALDGRRREWRRFAAAAARVVGA
jgi:Transcriptional regulator PadR-like family